jgi:ATP-dependent protease ClpP protease subunit
MRKLAGLVFTIFLCGFCAADTFTNKETKEKLTGYQISCTEEGKSKLCTQEKGNIDVNIFQWDAIYDKNGRTNKVVVVPLNDEIMLQMESNAIEKAIEKASSQGALFIIFELDTPGGNVECAQKICFAIRKSSAPVYAFIKGGKFGGALSAGAALALACNKIYMADGTIIGAATLVTLEQGKVRDAKETFGQDIGEKYSSAWRGYLASLAERNGRPGLLARAMVDRDTEVIEVSDSGQRLFIDPINKKTNQQVVQTWNKKGTLLTLTSKEAVKAGIADKEITSRQNILEDANAANAQVVMDDSAAKAVAEFQKIKLKATDILKTLDLKSKEIEGADTPQSALKILREADENYKALLKLTKEYPDLKINAGVLEEQINYIKAASKEIKTKTRRRSRQP